MSFKDRLNRGNEWAESVIARIRENGKWSIVPMGAEHVAPEVHSRLSFMENPDATARFIRYMPDGFAVHVERDNAFFFDAKCGETIEKDAFMAYRAFAADGRRVFIYIQKSGSEIYRVPVDELEFVDSKQKVAQYPSPMPVDDEGWIAPRLWPKEKYMWWKRKNSNASGTPYRYLDFDKMTKFKVEPGRLSYGGMNG